MWPQAAFCIASITVRVMPLTYKNRGLLTEQAIDHYSRSFLETKWLIVLMMQLCDSLTFSAAASETMWLFVLGSLWDFTQPIIHLTTWTIQTLAELIIHLYAHASAFSGPMQRCTSNECRLCELMCKSINPREIKKWEEHCGGSAGD